uniref:hypothetical protein n=1 Tax=Pseudomonas putida TaxID=303 RepID=UPI00155D9222|nr:hypothetical protein [Pseudomonas putida]
MHHPAVPQARQGLVDAERHHFPLFLGAAGVVIPLVQPGGHKGAVLAHDHAVIDHGGVIEQIGQAGILGAMLLELQLGIDSPDAGKEDEQQNRTEHSNGNCDCFDHLYCFP